MIITKLNLENSVGFMISKQKNIKKIVREK